MPVFLQTSNRAVPVKDSLRKRERQVMAAAMAHAVDVDAFSISFVAKKSSVKALIYMRQPVAQESSHTLEDDDGEEQEAGNEQAALAPVPAPGDNTRDARSSSQAASLSGASTQVVGNKSPASAKGAPRSKPAASRIDKTRSVLLVAQALLSAQPRSRRRSGLPRHLAAGMRWRPTRLAADLTAARRHRARLLSLGPHTCSKHCLVPHRRTMACAAASG